jgi:hypothetical protein
MATVNSPGDIAGDAVSRPVECECDRTLAVVATTASRAHESGNPSMLGHGNPSVPERSGMAVRITSVV